MDVMHKCIYHYQEKKAWSLVAMILTTRVHCGLVGSFPCRTCVVDLHHGQRAIH